MLRVKLDYRPYANSTVIDWIYTRKCIHFDAWIHYSFEKKRFYVEIETRIAGIERLAYQVVSIALADTTLQYIQEEPDAPERTHMVTLNSDATVKRKMDVMVQRIHDHYIMPRVNHVRASRQFKRTSVALHYIDAPSLDPTEGINNHYDPNNARGRPATKAWDVQMAKLAREGHDVSERFASDDEYRKRVTRALPTVRQKEREQATRSERGRKAWETRRFRERMAMLQKLLDGG